MMTLFQIDQHVHQLHGFADKEPKILDEKLTIDFLIYLSYFTVLSIHHINQIRSISKSNKI